MDKRGRIGVYGGTFDPIHKTHLDIARAALAFGKLRKILFVVAAIPPHKQHDVHASPEDRLALVTAALKAEPDFEPCGLELKREGPSYTVDTLRSLQAIYPEDKLVLIMGHDSLVDLPQWRDYNAILDLAHILSVPRVGASATIPAELNGRHEKLPFTAQDTSSTRIRRQIAAGEPFENQVPPDVAEYIKLQGMYGYGNQ